LERERACTKKCSYPEWKNITSMASGTVSAAAIAQAAIAAAKLKEETEKTSRSGGGGVALVGPPAKSGAPPASVAGGTAFQVMVNGQIESVSVGCCKSYLHGSYAVDMCMFQYPGVGNLYCRYTITYGMDWRVIHVSVGDDL
jgi:hypothetical protein